MTIIDTRDKLSFAGGHFPGSINIQDNSSFSTWAGWMLEYDKPFLIVARDSRIEALTKALIRIGLDNIVGYVNDMDKIANAGYQTETIKQITVQQLKDKNENFLFLDVRGYAEFNAGHIEDALNIHAGYLKDHIDKLPKDRKIVVHCAGGDRSAIAASLLKRNGYDNIYNLTCGMNGWKQAGLLIVSETPDEVLA